MPLLLLLLLSLFVGGSAFLATPIGVLISIVLGISDYLADVPLAVLRVQQIPDTSFLLLLLACLLLLIARFRGREFCIGLTCIGAFSVYLASDTAEVLISKSGSTIAIYIDGELKVSGGRVDSFRARAWRQYWAKPENNVDGSIEFVRSGPNRRFQIGDNRYITHADTISAVREGCSAGDIVILPRRYDRYCKGSTATISFEQLKKEGPLGIKQPLTSKPVLIWANSPN
jgi:competence protein ComEC